MKVWKNTSTLDGFDEKIIFTKSKSKADIALLGSKPIDINQFPNLKGIFRVGIGKDNIPEKEAKDKGIIIGYPSDEIINIIYEETANFTCGLILRMLYSDIGTLNPWLKKSRQRLSQKKLLVIGTGNIGRRVAKCMRNFMIITTFDVKHNLASELRPLVEDADCITIHIPKVDENISFFDSEKISWIKNGGILINTARGAIVNEDALFIELASDRIKAAFDVYWEEPYNGKLKKFYPDPFFMTPHVASTTVNFLKGCRKDLDNMLIKLKNIH